MVPHHPIHVIASVHFFSPANWYQFNIESSNVPCFSIYSSYSLFYASHYVLEFTLCRSFILSIFLAGGRFCTHTFLFLFFSGAVFSHGYLSTKTWSFFFFFNTIQKTPRSWHLILSLHSKQVGKKWEQWHILFSWAPKSLRIVTTVMKLKDTCSLEEKLWQI